MSKGLFVVVEGIEGVGKTTNVGLISRLFCELTDKRVIQIREPGGTLVGDQIRSILLDPGMEICAESELFLLNAARAENINSKIIPNLEQGNIVVCDRFVHATYAYQGGGRGLPDHSIDHTFNIISKGVYPDHVFLLDANVEVAIARAKNRSSPDRIESESIDFFRRAKEKYLDLARKEPEIFHLIDCNGSFKDVEEQISSVITKICQDLA